MRSVGQEAHNNWLLSIDKGEITSVDTTNDTSTIEIPDSLIEKENLITTIFGSDVERLTEEELSKRED
ncbi:hypothetical protein DSO57_1025582 [Entomophthora muscae]|uniref:Uncharacterized protein n=1 Tax=Entomophthora muscae TaxID=34485 RepID=A0ACC2T2D0_9FUNG|nr:hypothetical protein DSO57_1025582 [Entomophthora muscae]